MTDLFWPGDHRADGIFTAAAFLTAMVEVENAWLDVLVDAGIAPSAARTDLRAQVSAADAELVAAGADVDGNPVIGLVALLRDRAGGHTARWVHRGLTSQDVIDTALTLCLREALSRIGTEIATQVRALVELIERHHQIPMLARTLTQPALPSTIGARLATWLTGVLDGADTVAALPALPVQVGGAAGTLAATTELAGSPQAALGLTDALGSALALAPAAPWHTTRSVITRAGDAFVTCCDAWAHLANDVATGSRAEIGEFAEGRGGGSSTMPHKRNPVLSTLIRRSALTAPHLGALLHAASADTVDARSHGGWHAEWATLRTLARTTVVAASHTSELLSGLEIDAERARTNLSAAGDLLAEQRTMAELTGRPALPGYTGAADHLVDAALQRARRHLKEAT